MMRAVITWLQDGGAPLEGLLHRLTTAERAELLTFRDAHRARSFLLSRLMLHRLMGEYLAQAPEATLSREPSGRLVVSGAPGWHISVSHCPGRIAVMLAEAPCGVDIEIFRDVPWQRIARRYFSRGEQEWLRSLPDSKARQAFLQLWTLKEAGVKAMGKGLANHLASLAFDLSGEKPRLADDCTFSGMTVHQVIGEKHLLAAALMTGHAVSWQIHQLTMGDLQLSA